MDSNDLLDFIKISVESQNTMARLEKEELVKQILNATKEQSDEKH